MKHTDKMPKPIPCVLDTVIGATSFVSYLIDTRAPDGKSQKKALETLRSCYGALTKPVTMLWNLSGAFEELSDIAADKASAADTFVKADKLNARDDFYRMIANWASDSFKLTEKALDAAQQSSAAAQPVDCVRDAEGEPVTMLWDLSDAIKATPPVDYPKDAEDDSDPYIKTTPLYGPRPPTPKDAPAPYSLEWARTKLESELTHSNFSKAQVLAAMNVFNEDVGYLTDLSHTVSVCDLLERFGDTCADLSHDCANKDASEDEQFWDACVTLSDELRANVAANTISAKVNYTTTPRNEVCHSAEPEDAGQMWEVCGDPHRALFYTKLHAEHWAREMFPTENADKRYARIQYRNILKFPA